MPLKRDQLIRRRPSLDLIAAAATQVADPYDTSLHFGGLVIGAAAPGSPVTCSFTVDHERPWSGIELKAATETWSGAVADSATGAVILTLSKVETKLWNGQYVAVRLGSTALLAATEAGKSLTVTAGPAELFGALVIGAQAGVTSGVLTGTVTAQSAPDASLPTTPAGTGVTTVGGSFWTSSLGTAIIIAGVGTVVVVGGVSYLRHRARNRYRRIPRAAAAPAGEGYGAGSIETTGAYGPDVPADAGDEDD